MHFRAFLIAGILTATLLSGTARAMSFLDFSRLNDDDMASFTTALVQGTADMLKAHGHPDQAAKALALFKDPGKKGGVAQFALNLRTMNTINNRNATNPNNRVYAYQVEDAMELTLKDAGIEVPHGFLLSIGKEFHPVGPPRQHPMGTGT